MCQRKYTDQVVADMQRIAEPCSPTITAANQLQERLQGLATDIQQMGVDSRTAKVVAALELLMLELDELAVPDAHPAVDVYRACCDEDTGLYGVEAIDGGLLYEADMSESEASDLAMAHNAGCASYEEALAWLERHKDGLDWLDRYDAMKAEVDNVQ